MGRPRSKTQTKLVRVPVDIIEKLERVMPDFDNPNRFRIAVNASMVNIEDILAGRRPKKRR